MSARTVKEAREALAQKSRLVRQFFDSEAGREVMKLLREEFYDGALVAADPYQTYYRLGRRDVVAYLIELSEYGEK